VPDLVRLERTARALGANVGRDLAAAIGDRAGPRLVRADPPVGDGDVCPAPQTIEGLDVAPDSDRRVLLQRRFVEVDVACELIERIRCVAPDLRDVRVGERIVMETGRVGRVSAKRRGIRTLDRGRVAYPRSASVRTP